MKREWNPNWENFRIRRDLTQTGPYCFFVSIHYWLGARNGYSPEEKRQLFWYYLNGAKPSDDRGISRPRPLIKLSTYCVRFAANLIKESY